MLTEEDKKFLLSFEAGEPDWELFAYPEFANYPSVQWKLKNLQTLKEKNPQKLQQNVDLLQQAIY